MRSLLLLLLLSVITDSMWTRHSFECIQRKSGYCTQTLDPWLCIAHYMMEVTGLQMGAKLKWIGAMHHSWLPTRISILMHANGVVVVVVVVVVVLSRHHQIWILWKRVQFLFVASIKNIYGGMDPIIESLMLQPCSNLRQFDHHSWSMITAQMWRGIQILLQNACE